MSDDKKQWLCGDAVRSFAEATRCKYLVRGMVPNIHVVPMKIPRKIVAPHETGFDEANVPMLSGSIQAMYMICESPEMLEDARRVLPAPHLGQQLKQLATSADICCGCPCWVAKTEADRQAEIKEGAQSVAEAEAVVPVAE